VRVLQKKIPRWPPCSTLCRHRAAALLPVELELRSSSDRCPNQRESRFVKGMRMAMDNLVERVEAGSPGADTGSKPPETC